VFSAIKKIVERIKNKMFPTTTIKRAFNVDDIDIAISSDMINSGIISWKTNSRGLIKKMVLNL